MFRKSNITQNVINALRLELIQCIRIQSKKYVNTNSAIIKINIITKIPDVCIEAILSKGILYTASYYLLYNLIIYNRT